jgi:hypothetical protein
MQSLVRLLAGYTFLLSACSADPGATSAQAGRQQVTLSLSRSLDGLARPESACMSGRLGNQQSCETAAGWKQLLGDACTARGMQVAELTPTESCGSEQFRFADFSCCPEIAADPIPNCQNLVDGGPSVCRTLSSWKERISASCAAQGQQLGSASFGASCGVDSTSSVTYSCCAAQPVPTAPTDCQPYSDGGPKSCQSAVAWKLALTAQCQSRGLGLGDLSLSGDCGSGSFQSASYLCCGVRATPPPTPSCQSVVYPARSCRDEATWKQLASDLCQGQGLTVGAVGYIDSCGSGSWQDMKYVCCPPANDPPPPPPSSCTYQLLDEAGACNDHATWRDRAVRGCAGVGAQLKDLAFGTPCAADKYLQAKAQCCP